MKKLLFIMLAVSASIISGCAKKGCTDVNAVNYESAAKKDDGSCTYEGKVVFWYGKATADKLVADGSIALTYYVDGAVVGSSAASVYWTGAPDCGQSASITAKKDLGIAKNKTYEYRIIDQDGDEIWKGTQNWTGNTCLKLQLTY